jgi:hypothetical protein
MIIQEKRRAHLIWYLLHQRCSLHYMEGWHFTHIVEKLAVANHFTKKADLGPSN